LVDRDQTAEITIATTIGSSATISNSSVRLGFGQTD
jgi:hypothetical protein